MLRHRLQPGRLRRRARSDAPVSRKRRPPAMAERMLQFVRLSPGAAGKARRRRPAARISARSTGNSPPAPRPSRPAAAASAACPSARCIARCNNNIPDWLKLTAEGRLEEAYEVAAATNTFPEICGRICPQDRLCEGNCVIEKGFESVTIGAVEKYITDTAWENGWVKPPSPRQELAAEHRHHRRRPGRPRGRPSGCAAAATRSMSTTATTGSAG